MNTAQAQTPALTEAEYPLVTLPLPRVFQLASPPAIASPALSQMSLSEINDNDMQSAGKIPAEMLAKIRTKAKRAKEARQPWDEEFYYCLNRWGEFGGNEWNNFLRKISNGDQQLSVIWTDPNTGKTGIKKTYKEFNRDEADIWLAMLPAFADLVRDRAKQLRSESNQKERFEVAARVKSALELVTKRFKQRETSQEVKPIVNNFLSSRFGQNWVEYSAFLSQQIPGSADELETHSSNALFALQLLQEDNCRFFYAALAKDWTVREMGNAHAHPTSMPLEELTRVWKRACLELHATHKQESDDLLKLLNCVVKDYSKLPIVAVPIPSDSSASQSPEEA